MDFTGARARLDNVVQDIEQARTQYEGAVAAIGAANNLLGNLPTTYATVISTIDAGAAANPTDAAWQTAKAEKDLHVGDFAALKAVVQAAVDALAAL